MLKVNLGIKKEDKFDWFELILKVLSVIGLEGKKLSKGMYLWIYELIRSL